MPIPTRGIGTPSMVLHGKNHEINWGHSAVTVFDGKDVKAKIPNDRVARMLGAMPLQTLLEKEIARQT